MKSVFLLLNLLIITFSACSQRLHHQMLSSQGGTSTTQTGTVVKYTIGQQSVTGIKTDVYTNSDTYFFCSTSREYDTMCGIEGRKYINSLEK